MRNRHTLIGLLALIFVYAILSGGGNIGAQDGDDPLRGIDLPPADTPTASIGTTANALTLLSPAPDTALTLDNPTLTWTAPPGAAWLRVRVWRPNGQPLFDQRFSADELTTLCADRLCRLNLAEQGVRLREGRRYTWRVIAMLPDAAEPVRTERRGFRVGDVSSNENGNLPLIYNETFDTGELFPAWIHDVTRYLVPHPQHDGRALYIDRPVLLPLSYGGLTDTSLQADMILHEGAVRLGMRHSIFGSYSATLDTDGNLKLWRAETLLASTTVQPNIGQWSTIRLSVIGNQLTVTLNGADVLAVQDDDPLPYGTTYIASSMGSNDYLLDNVVLHGVRISAPEPALEQAAKDMMGELQRDTPVQSRFMGSNGRIAFSRPSPSLTSAHIYTIEPDGSGLANLTMGDGGSSISFAYNTDPAFSPDASKIAFASDATGFYAVWTMNADGSSAAMLFNDARFPTWRGDNLQIAVENNNEIKIISTINGQVFQTISPENGAYEPSWSPDSTRLAYSAGEPYYPPGGGISFQLLIKTYNLETQEIRILTDYPGLHTEWSPDSTKIVNRGAGLGTMRIIDAHTGSQITDLGVFGRSPSWSPDGTQIVYQTQNDGLALISMSGGSPIIIPNTSGAADPDWGIGQLFITNTPRPTQALPTATPIHSATPSLTPTSSPSWQELATIFPLPMNPPAGTPQARLSNGDFVERGRPTEARYHLCSRDMNPLGVVGGNHRLITSANAEVWLIDTKFEPFPTEAPENGNLGYFTVIRVKLQSLPGEILSQLSAFPTMQDSRIQALLTFAKENPGSNVNIGWLYISYAHQEIISISTPARRQYPVIIPTAQIGLSGRTGLAQFPLLTEHLDISVYYVSGPISNINGVNIQAVDPHAGILRFEPSFQDYFNIYQSTRDLNEPYVNQYGLVALVDPLTLWPLLEDGFTGTIWGLEDCPY